MDSKRERKGWNKRIISIPTGSYKSKQETLEDKSFFSSIFKTSCYVVAGKVNIKKIIVCFFSRTIHLSIHCGHLVYFIFFSACEQLPSLLMGIMHMRRGEARPLHVFEINQGIFCWPFG